MLYSFVLIILSLIIFFWIRFHVKHWYLYDKIKNFDSTRKTIPLFGDVHLIFGIYSMDGISKFVINYIKTFDRSARAWIFGKLVIVAKSPDDIKTILTSPYCINKASFYKALPASTYGLVASHENYWKSDRRLFNSTFGTKQTQAFFPSLNDVGRNICKELQLYNNGKVFDLRKAVSFSLINGVMQFMFGAVLETKDLVKCSEMIDEDASNIGKQMIISVFFSVFNQLKELLKLFIAMPLEDFKKVLDPITQNANEKISKEMKTNFTLLDSENDMANNDNYIQRVFRLHNLKLINQAQVDDHILTILGTGFESPMRGVLQTCLCAALYPQFQEKLYEELKNKTDPETNIDSDCLGNLVYLDQFCKESLRHLPVPLLIGRRASADIKLEHGVVPAGTDVLISIDALHQDKMVWGPNAENFDPDNFLPEKCINHHPCCFLSFSYGKRNCIAYKFSVVLIKTIVAYIIKNYQLSTPLKHEDLDYGYGISATLKNGYMVSVKKRN